MENYKSKINIWLCNSTNPPSPLLGKCNTLYDQESKKQALFVFWIITYIAMHIIVPFAIGFWRYGTTKGMFYYYLLPLSEYGFYVPAFYLKLILGEQFVALDYIFLILSLIWMIADIFILFNLIGLYGFIPIIPYSIEIYFLLGIQDDALLLSGTWLILLSIIKLVLMWELIGYLFWSAYCKKHSDNKEVARILEQKKKAQLEAKSKKNILKK